LPQRVEAAAVKSTGTGGRTSSYSPFGVVEPTDEELDSLVIHVDPEFSSEESGTTITRRVRVINVSDSAPIPNVAVTFFTDDGTLGNGIGQMINATDANGQAIMTWNLPAEPGVYSLVASSFTSSVSFTVAGADDGELTPLSCELEGTIKSLNSNRPVNVRFSNGLGAGGDPISVWWLNFDGVRAREEELGVPYAVLPSTGSDSSYVQPTYVTHPWILTSPGEPETCYGIFLPLDPGEGTFGGNVTIEE